MLVAGKVSGIIAIRFQEKRALRREEIELTRALAHQAMLALQWMRLARQSRQEAVVAERNRLARDIHDTLAQGFTGVVVQLEAAADATAKGLSQAAAEHLERAGGLARESLREARRSVQALRPRVLEERSMCQALESLFRKMTEGTFLRTEFVRQGEPRRIPSDWEDHLLRIGQEVLTNTLRHAQANRFQAQIAFGSDQLRLELRDDGRGFDPVAKHDGFGLLGVCERVQAMGGQLAIQAPMAQAPP
jgi:signal transduction histidine kinase